MSFEQTYFDISGTIFEVTRPVTLTAILAKCFERALLPKITTHTQPVMDKMQFAIPSKSVDRRCHYHINSRNSTTPGLRLHVCKISFHRLFLCL